MQSLALKVNEESIFCEFAQARNLAQQGAGDEHLLGAGEKVFNNHGGKHGHQTGFEEAVKRGRERRLALDTGIAGMALGGGEAERENTFPRKAATTRPALPEWEPARCLP